MPNTLQVLLGYQAMYVYMNSQFIHGNPILFHLFPYWTQKRFIKELDAIFSGVRITCKMLRVKTRRKNCWNSFKTYKNGMKQNTFVRLRTLLISNHFGLIFNCLNRLEMRTFKIVVCTSHFRDLCFHNLVDILFVRKVVSECNWQPSCCWASRNGRHQRILVDKSYVFLVLVY